jgi:hypothetical protein
VLRQRHIRPTQKGARAAAVGLVFVWLATPAHAVDDVRKIEIRSQLIAAFSPAEPTRTQFGPLMFRGGLVLQSSDPDFGGLSGLRVAADGEHFLAISDRGHWLRGRLVYRNTAPIAIAEAELAPMIGPDGRPLKSRGWYDTEALSVQDGMAYVGIERVHQIVRFDLAKEGLRARGQIVPAPAGIKLLPKNQGIECLEMAPPNSLLAGTLIAISERGLDSRHNLKGFLIGASPGLFVFKRTDDFDVSDCAATPDGDLLVLERRFSWLRGLAIRIRSVPIATIKAGATVDGRELFFADLSQEIDNMEGLSVHRAADGAVVLTLVSDDNFSPLQRTLLLQFTLRPSNGPAAR